MTDETSDPHAEPASPGPATRMERYQKERERIQRAAFALISDASPSRTSVRDILREAGLSTRAFYRHFRSKDELILTMYRTAARRLGEELSALVAEAPGPAQALEAWVRHYLAVVFDPRRARQTAVLASAEVRAVPGYDQVREEQAVAHRTLLAEVIRSGRRLGVFSAATDPDEDARAVMSVVAGLIEARLAGTATLGWAEATEHTTALFLRAFGASGTE